MKHAFKLMIILTLFIAACTQGGQSESDAEQQAALEQAMQLDSLTNVLDETQKDIDSTMEELDSLLEGIEE